MNYFIQFLIVFDLICFGVYFGGDIVCTALAKVRKKTDEEEFEIYKVEDDTDTSKPALSIDAIRHLFRGEVHDFVCNKLLPSGQETLSALTEPEQTAARFLFCALIGYLKEEAPKDEQSFPMVMEMLNYAEGAKEDGDKDVSTRAAARCQWRRLIRVYRHVGHVHFYRRCRIPGIQDRKSVA